MKSPAFDTFQNILFLDLRPWMNTNIPEVKYKELQQNLKKEYYAFQPLYEVAFTKPLSARRKYYYALIETEAIQYLNAFNNEMSAALNDQEKKYWVHTTLTKSIAQKFKEVKDTIESFGYHLNKFSDSSTNSNTLDDAYIIQLLRFQLIRIYLEIQDAFKEHLKEDALTFEELNEKYFSEALSMSYIKEATNLKLPTPVNQIKPQPELPSFEVKAFHFRDSKRGIITYDVIIKNRDRFSRVEEQLFQNRLIDEDYNFRNEHGQIQELAAVFQTLILKGYFNARQFPKNKEIKPIEIRKFLDDRYGSKTDKQFREWGNKPDKLASFVEARWMDRLPVS